jgi:glycine betaine/proline transport system ATP-binding protein
MMAEGEPIIVCEDVWKLFGSHHGSMNKMVNDLKSSGLTKEEASSKYGVVVGVREASFEVWPGEVFVIMGLSGSGKSTLLRCFNRLIDANFGRILVEGQDVAKMARKELRRMCQEQMSMVFQHFALIPSRTVLDNVALGLEVRGWSKQERRTKAMEAIELVGLNGWEDKKPSELSGGMQQRVGLARALAVDPDILLMDEPFSALDPLIRKQMQDEFLKLVKIVKKTILFITHDLDEAIKIGDRIAVMKDGLIKQIGTPEEIIMQPADDYVEEFVSAISRTKRETARNLMIDGDNWRCSPDDDLAALLDKMREEQYEALLCIDDDDQLLGALERETLREAVEDSGKPAVLTELLSDSYSVVHPDAGMEELLKLSAKTRTPLIVLDRKKRVDGLIPRAPLLRELADMV